MLPRRRHARRAAADRQRRAAAIGDDLDLLSLAPRHRLKSFAERLILPCGHYLLSFSQDLAKVQAPDSDDVTATGQFMLFRRGAYDAVGGHAAVHAAICEDLELARLHQAPRPSVSCWRTAAGC